MTQPTPNQPNFHPLSGKRLIVAGAGISGLTFAIALRQHLRSIPATSLPTPPTLTIYEREPRSLPPGREGYTISIRSDAASGGIQTLNKLGLLERALEVAVTGIGGGEGEGGAFCMWNREWRELVSMRVKVPEGLKVGGMRIARRALRDVLIETAEREEGNMVCWDVACTGAERREDGRVQVRLSDGSVVECDVLIAADGASSKIRETLRPQDKLSFAGAVCLSGTARFAEGEVPKPMNKNWGSLLGGGEGKGLFVSPVDSRSALWNLSYLASQPRDLERKKQPLSEDDARNVCEEALEVGKVFSEPFATLVRASDPSTVMIFNARDKQPFCNADENADCRCPVIFIGDSNHAVSPFAGNGANLAMVSDSISLKVFCSLHADLLCFCLDGRLGPRGAALQV